jgi:antirestriction protein ArdC
MEAKTARLRQRRWIQMVDIYEKITGKIVELLEEGTVPWRQPWSGAVPTNLASLKPYNGINFLLLGCLGYE